MNEFPEVMLDLETLGRSAGCVVHEVALVRFNSKTREAGEKLHLYISIEDSLAHGLTIDEETLAWWNRQGGPRQDRPHTLHHSASLIADFLTAAPVKRLWAWGTCFDLPLIRAAFEAASVRWPLHYAVSRDARTVWDLAFPGVIHDRAAGHDALADCYQQIRQLWRAADTMFIPSLSKP